MKLNKRRTLFKNYVTLKVKRFKNRVEYFYVNYVNSKQLTINNGKYNVFQ